MLQGKFRAKTTLFFSSGCFCSLTVCGKRAGQGLACRDKNIADVLDMRVAEALELYVRKKCRHNDFLIVLTFYYYTILFHKKIVKLGKKLCVKCFFCIFVGKSGNTKIKMGYAGTC